MYEHRVRTSTQPFVFSERISMASSESENDELVTLGSEMSNGEHDNNEVIRFTIYSEKHRQYRRFNVVSTELTVRLLPPVQGDASDALTHFQASVKHLFDYALTFSRRDLNPPCSATVPRFLERSFNF